jgi:hypothetical protein
MIAAASVAGCARVSEHLSHAGGHLPGIGLPANAPERPAEKLAFPAVHDMPPQRTTAVLTADEQRLVERDLVAARENQQGPAKPRQEAARKPAARPAAAPSPQPDMTPRRAPTSSSQSIY